MRGWWGEEPSDNSYTRPSMEVLDNGLVQPVGFVHFSGPEKAAESALPKTDNPPSNPRWPLWRLLCGH